MKELWFWRAATAIACIGWGITWWTAAPAPPAERPALEVAQDPGPQADARPMRGKARGKAGPLGRGGAMRGKAGAGAALEGAPSVEVSEESLALAKEELSREREQRFLARMEERHSAALEDLTDFADQHELSEEEVLGMEEAIDRRLEAMGEAFQGEGMEPDARKEHIRSVVDAFEMQVTGVLGEELGALYLEQAQRPSWGRVGREDESE